MENFLNYALSFVSNNSKLENSSDISGGLTEKSGYDYFMQYFRGYVTIICISLGIVGNILSLIIFPRCVNKSAASVMYLTCLAFTDLCCLIFYGLTEWIRSGAKDVLESWDLELLAISPILCKIVRYIGFTSFFLSSWIIISVSYTHLTLPTKA